jgi:aminopeptidase 2
MPFLSLLLPSRYIPLSVLSTDSTGKMTIDRQPVLETRERTLTLDTTKPFKLNAGTSGVCE